MSGPDFLNFAEGIEAEAEGEALKRRLEQGGGLDIPVDDDEPVDGETAAALEAEEEVAEESRERRDDL